MCECAPPSFRVVPEDSFGVVTCIKCRGKMMASDAINRYFEYIEQKTKEMTNDKAQDGE